MKPARRRIEVNLNELDQLLDHARSEPLSESGYEKLRTALHTLAELLSQRRSTEKTSAVVERPDIATAGTDTALETDEKQPGLDGMQRPHSQEAGRSRSHTGS